MTGRVSNPRRATSRQAVVWCWVLLLLPAGCASPPPRASIARSFHFERDTFAFANELVWEYQFDPETGKRTVSRRQPPAAYKLRCFVLARSARQFFDHATFDSRLPRADEAAYRSCIRKVMGRDPRAVSDAGRKVVIPGYSNLRQFSAAWEPLLKRECGGAWQSYVQRGHWRMVFPFSRKHQQQTAGQLEASLRRGHPPIVHVVRFPALSINHALLVFAIEEHEEQMDFLAYDPNDPDGAARLIYKPLERRFEFSARPYFAGGPVDVYEIYSGPLY